MDIVQEISNVSSALKQLFKDKDELVGFHDWDTFIYCTAVLDKIAIGLANAAKSPVVETNGVEVDANGRQSDK